MAQTEENGKIVSIKTSGTVIIGLYSIPTRRESGIAVITKSKKLSASVLNITTDPVNQNAMALIKIRNKTVIKVIYVERLRILPYSSWLI